jgi:hypothetical protein
MTPEVDQILNLSASQLLSSLAPQLPAGYAQGAASLIAFMMMFSAQEYERAADIRAAENADMRALFAELAPGVADAVLRRALETAALGKDASLTISALDAGNGELRKLLIALQIEIERTKNTRAAKRIWAVLGEMARRRVLKLPGT